MTIAFYVNWNVFGNNVKVMDFGNYINKILVN